MAMQDGQGFTDTSGGATAALLATGPRHATVAVADGPGGDR